MLSVLIVNWNTKALLEACLQSIYQHPTTIRFEVIVVDNNSTDGSATMVQERFPQVQLILPGANTGYARGNNLCFAAAKGDYLLTLNPDTELPEGCLDKAVQILEDNPNYGVLGVQLIGPDGNVQRSVRGFPTVTGIFGALTGLSRTSKAFDSYQLNAFDYTKEQPAPQPMGTFLLFQRAQMEKVVNIAKPFDEGFPIFFNEVDLLKRLDEGGVKCLYSPAIKIFHHHGAGTKQVRKPMIWESHKSLVRYLHLHETSMIKKLFLIPVSAIIYAAAFIRAKGYSAGFRP